MLITVIITSFVISVLLSHAVKRVPAKYLWLTSLFPAALFLFFISNAGAVLNQGAIEENVSWYSSLGVDLQFQLDGLSLLFCLLITGIGSFIFAYASGYMGKHEHISRFYLLISIFMSAMLGLVVSDNLLLLFVFWEITTISSYLLVGFNHKSESARKSALQALIITGIGGLIMLAGFLILGSKAGTFTISELAVSDIDSKSINIICWLILAGCFTKSAQFPFHFWLPNAMEAPTPVSAYLHSATMVKAGIYVIYRLNSHFNDAVVWSNSLLYAGAITMVFAACSGIFYRDLKKILAYSTLSVLGIIVMLAGIGTDLAIKTGITMILAHALYKATLFMVAGSIDHETGTRNTLELKGLKSLMPFTFAAALLAGLSQAGIFPFFGFIGKEYLLKSGLYSENSILITSATVAAGALIAVLAFTICLHPFIGPKFTSEERKVHEAPVSMLVGPILLSLSGLILGFFPFIADKYLISAAVEQSGFNNTTSLKLWEGINTPLILSLSSLAIAALIYIFRLKIWQFADKLASKSGFRFDKLFTQGLNAFIKFCKWQTKIVQNGSLKTYIILSISGFLIIFSSVFFSLEDIPYAFDFSDVYFPEYILFAALIASALLAIFSNSLMSSLIALGILGFGMAVIYTLFGAPDLAITQIMVETLTAVMFMAVIYKLPPLKKYSSQFTNAANLAFSSLCGITITLLILKAQALQISSPVSEKMAEISYTEAKGRNIVNVILVDFRALDTLGEIAVLATAAIGAAILLKKAAARRTKS